jgi:Trypsin
MEVGSMRRKLGGIVGLAVAVAAVWAAPAPAIVNGHEDGQGHPNVGALLVDLPEGTLAVCSGSVLRATEFLTAGHCTDFLDSLGLAPGQVSVTFEPDLHLQQDGTVAPASRIQSAGWVTHPTFHGTPAKAYDDVGVVHLAVPAVGRTPVELPSQSYLDAQAAGGRLEGHLFEIVGYGYNGVDRSIGSPNVTISWLGKRFVATEPFMALTPYYLKLLGNSNATGLGGACFGDSGGPAFWAPGSRLEVALTSAGDPNCQALNERQRLDTASVLNFLAPFRR